MEDLGPHEPPSDFRELDDLGPVTRPNVAQVRRARLVAINGRKVEPLPWAADVVAAR